MTMPHDIVFSDQALELQARAREIADRLVRPAAAEHDRLRVPNVEARQAVADAGLFGILVPEEHGGLEAGSLALCLVAEELAKADPAFGVAYAAGALGTLPLLLGGSDRQKSEWLPSIARGETSVAFSMSEKTAGSDASALSTTAEKEGDSYLVRGEKKWTTNGGEADLYTVFCVTDAGSASRRISAFLVEKGMTGLRVGKLEDKMGIRSVPVAEMHFDGVRVPAANLLGGQEGRGFPLAMAALDHARPCAAAQAVGAAQGALDLALVYATGRRQYDQPISNLQLVQKMLADMAMKTEAARWLTYAAAAQADRPDQVDLADRPLGDNRTRSLAAGAKCFATDVAMEVATDAVQVFGGYGFMEDYPIAKFFRDAKIFQIYEGTNQIQRLIVAMALIKSVESLEHLREHIPREEQETYER